MILFAIGEGTERNYKDPSRASIIARACLARGIDVSFICADQEVYDQLRRRGFSRIQLCAYDCMLKESASRRPPILVWDAARPLTHKEITHLHRRDIFIIEFDVSEGMSFADEVVNGFEPVLHSATGRRYRLTGPDHVVVDKSFSDAKEWRRASSFFHNRPDLFVCFGGEHGEQLLRSTLAVLTDIPACRSIQIRAVASLAGNEAVSVQREFAGFRNIQIYREADAALKAQLMRFSLLGILSFGPSLAEAMAAELPVFLINGTRADGERADEALNSIFAGVGKTFGYAPQIDWEAFRRELEHLMERPREIERMQMSAARTVDGQGAQRIARCIQNYMENRAKGQTSWFQGEKSRSVIPLSR